jgi:hypothetical protein
MQQLAEITADLITICVHQGSAATRNNRDKFYDTLLLNMVKKMREEQANEPGYFGNP